MSAYKVLSPNFHRASIVTSMMADATGEEVPVHSPGPLLHIAAGTILEDVSEQELAAFGDLLAAVDTPAGVGPTVSDDVRTWFARDRAAETTAEEHAAIATIQGVLHRALSGEADADEMAAAEGMAEEFGLSLWAEGA